MFSFFFLLRSHKKKKTFRVNFIKKENFKVLAEENLCDEYLLNEVGENKIYFLIKLKLKFLSLSLFKLFRLNGIDNNQVRMPTMFVNDLISWFGTRAVYKNFRGEKERKTFPEGKLGRENQKSNIFRKSC